MDFIQSQKSDGIVTLTLRRGKVNALNDAVIEEIRNTLGIMEHDPKVTSIILTGAGKFFSFGFDIPELILLTKEQFTKFITKFTNLYAYMFFYPKPVVAAINGHAIAGGCMLTLACDHKVMVTGKAKISLNEIGFGATVFAGSTEMLRFWVGSANATEVLYSGTMYSAEEAEKIGLVHEIVSESNLMDVAHNVASGFATKSPQTFTSMKSLLRKRAYEEMVLRENESIREFLDIWYSETTWAKLQNIKIH